jgi:hypothetical protein
VTVNPRDVAFECEPDRSLQRLIDESAARSASWTPDEVIPHGLTSAFRTEDERARWAPFLVATAFGEATAYEGFGPRISGSLGIGARNWLCVHLMDESKHALSFLKFFKYFYPTMGKNVQRFFPGLEVVRYFARARKYDIQEWLLSTQIIEYYNKHAFLSVRETVKEDAVAHAFFQLLIDDERRHLSSIGMLLDEERGRLGDREWRTRYGAFAEEVLRLGRQVFIGNDGAFLQHFEPIGVDAEAFCRAAETEFRGRHRL